jgi:hypothetical protein
MKNETNFFCKGVSSILNKTANRMLCFDANEKKTNRTAIDDTFFLILCSVSKEVKCVHYHVSTLYTDMRT